MDLILRAREFRIRSWFIKGVSRILTGIGPTSTETLIGILGMSTACKIVDLHFRTTLAGVFGPHPDVGTIPAMGVPLGQVRCVSCTALLFTKPVSCRTTACGAVVDPHSYLHSAYLKSGVASLCLTAGTIGFRFKRVSLGCSACQKQLCPLITCTPCREPVEKMVVWSTKGVVNDEIVNVFREELEAFHDL